MRKFISIIMVCLVCVGSVWSQTERTQLLIFRNTGDINLFFTNEVDSITLSLYDRDSVRHEYPVSQVFHTTDTTLVLSISEIDSVVVGNRNVTELKQGVKVITGDKVWMDDYDGATIRYRGDTPDDVLPQVGQRVFYGHTDEIFPAGLAAKVTAVTHTDSGVKVDVALVELDEIFSRLFYAGELRNEERLSGKYKASVNGGLNIKKEVELGEYGRLNLEGEADIVGRGILQPLKGYYHIDLDVSVELTADLIMKIEKKIEDEETFLLKDFPLGAYAGVFWPHLELKIFVSAKAEASLQAGMRFPYKAHFIYTRNRGKDIEKTVRNQGNMDKPSFNNEFLLAGELYDGLQNSLKVKILNMPTGLSLRNRVGPCLEGELGWGVLKALDRYDSELYTKSTLEASLRAQFAPTAFYWNFQTKKEEEKPVENLEFDLKLFKEKINLFPDFFETKGVNQIGIAKKKATTISTATKCLTELPFELKAGLQLADKEGNVIDSLFTDTLKENCNSIQGLQHVFTLPEGTGNIVKLEEMQVQPIFQYMGHIIRSCPVNVQNDSHLQPMIFAVGNGVTNMLSGVPFNGMARTYNTLYTVGPYLPVMVCDTVFAKPPSVHKGIFIDDFIETSWQSVDIEEVSYTFNEDGTGIMFADGREHQFVYAKNEPQTGNLRLTFADGEVKVLKVISFVGTTLKYTIPPSDKVYRLSGNIPSI